MDPYAKAIRRRWLVFYAVLAVSLLLVAGVALALRVGSVRRWRVTQHRELVARSVDSTWLATQRTRLAQGGADPVDSWVTPDGFLLMADGSFLISAYRCSHDTWDGKDLLIAWGSDGRWHELPTHFCKGFVTLQGAAQPASISDFLVQYADTNALMRTTLGPTDRSPSVPTQTPVDQSSSPAATPVR